MRTVHQRIMLKVKNQPRFSFTSRLRVIHFYSTYSNCISWSSLFKLHGMTMILTYSIPSLLTTWHCPCQYRRRKTAVYSMCKSVILGGSDGGDDIPDDVTRFGQVRGRLLHLPHGFLPGPEVKHERNCSLFEPKTSENFAKKVCFLFKNEALGIAQLEARIGCIAILFMQRKSRPYRHFLIISVWPAIRETFRLRLNFAHFT